MPDVFYQRHELGFESLAAFREAIYVAQQILHLEVFFGGLQRLLVELFVFLQDRVQDLFLYVDMCLQLGLDLLIKLFALSLVLSRFDLFKKPLRFPVILFQQFQSVHTSILLFN